MTKEELTAVLVKHKKWLDNAEGRRADLRGADLRGMNLCKVDLCKANLRGADLRGVNLCEANLYGVNLRGANLYGMNLRGADLREADLRGADLSKANLYEAKLPNFQICPEEGEFTAWKQLNCGDICKLLITGNRTSSLVGRKCRCSEAKVLEIFNRQGKSVNKGASIYDGHFVYHVNEVVSVANYDDDIRIECAPGIHFFMTRKEAEEY